MPKEIDLEEMEEEKEEEEELEEEVSPAESAPKPKRKRNRTKKYEFYDVEDNEIVRKKKNCPRCGSGVFMADHGERLSCGRCGYTEFRNK